ncbi:2-hydroxychromene-2-carboxylate isomerase [Herbaspirillum sp. Sphag1AN]|uniref:2-hydroxychromene-2-carboxylate isomerase n=1 Tax=unclassified Herbaspirillum TaxID=2624150 RepID=UPI00161A2A29|nr:MULTISPECIES: 2-hydroxychromene-2-carboxylate isomerase [unclassified Herbaspirillum]MBB3212888.1 2-hydroxychromene-2-carboxylate isomerase [Herbaspirillum sp. Sphag1AN]MBB3246085.1 2-hydroxychromene-2-carboxylate isomerase [Herbaspirillum sp. Sphag64]
MGKVCEYFFAPHSPFAYLGHERLVALAKQYDVQIALKPFDLSKVFGQSGGLPLAKRAPQRQAYRLKELARWSQFLDKPMNIQPTYFPVQSDAAARLIIATQLAHGTNAALALTGAVMRAIWEEEKNIADNAVLQAIADQLGHDGVTLLKSSETASVQAEFDRFTEEASAANVFGAPWYIVDGEGYWGQDRLDFVERAFAEKKGE